MPLIDAIDRIYTILNLSDTKGQEAYVNAFYDQVSCFIDDYLDDVPLFIEEWDNTLHASTIQSIDSGGIRILSIHKSKGLEYDNIIIPFCDWELEHRDIVWCGRKETPSQDDYIPIPYTETFDDPNNMTSWTTTPPKAVFRKPLPQKRQRSLHYSFRPVRLSPTEGEAHAPPPPHP